MDSDTKGRSSTAALLGRDAGVGVASTYKDKHLRAEDRKHDLALKRYADAKTAFLDKRRVSEAAKANLEKARGALEDLQAKEMELRAHADDVERSNLLTVAKTKKLRSLADQLTTLSQRMLKQRETLEVERQIMYRAEADMDTAEMELYKLRDMKAAAEAAREETQTKLEATAKARVRKEKAAIKRMEAQHGARQKAAEEVQAAVAAEAERKMKDARVLHKQALERVKTSNEQQRLVMEATKEIAQQQRTSRVKAVMSLKKNTEQAAADMKAANERKAKAVKARARREAKEAEDILADGGNPYEVFRKRDRDRDIARQVKKHQEAVAAAKLKLTASVLKEEEGQRAVEAVERRHKEYLREYQASLSRPVREAKVAQYIAERTRDGVDVLDPTGRAARVEPSQVTSIKDHKFGLGTHATQRPDIVEKIAAKPRNTKVTIDPRWLPKGDTMGADALDGTLADTAVTFEDGASQMASPPSKRIQVRAPSVLEQKIMAAARERQRAGIVKKQVVLGMEYKGCGFLPAPTMIEFKDFTKGVPMRMRLVLTNVSLTFNSFKILPLAPDIRGLFEVKHTPPGRMSAGMTCPVSIRFTPKANDDVSGVLKLLASTGPIEIPIRCTPKKALPEIRTPVVDLGTVTMGESKTLPLRLENMGALDVGVTVSGVDTDAAPSVTFKDVAVLSQYSKLSLPVTFAPMAEGAVEVLLEVSFDNPTCAPEQVLVKAVGVPPPLFVEEDTMDMQCCVYDKLYRSTLVVQNRGTTALKCLTSVPPALRRVLEFVPSMFYVQSRDSSGRPGYFSVAIKFRPTADVLTRKAMQQWLSPDNPSQFSVPIHVTSPDQVLPVEFRLSARLTSGEIELDPPALDFGRCFTAQTTSLPVAITNKSDLPQRFAFVSLPPEVTVQPNQGFGVLLPHETVSRTVMFSPASATMHRFTLSLSSTMNQALSLPMTGMGVVSPLKLSHSCVKLGTAVAGEVVQASVYLTNVGTADASFQFLEPHPSSEVVVSPLVGVVAPGKQARIQLDFAPTHEPPATAEEGKEDAKDDDAADSKVAVEGQDGGEEGEEGAPVEDGDAPAAASESKEGPPPDHVGTIVVSADVAPTEPWSRHAKWSLPCFVKAEGGKLALPVPEPAQLAHALALEVHTTTVSSKLTVDKKRVDFGQVSVGQSELATLRVHNKSSVEQDLVLAGLNPGGSFTFVNAPRTVAPGTYHDVVVQFRPLTNKRFVETPTVSSSSRGAALEVLLCGEGVSPTLTLDPPDGLLALGSIVAGDSTSATVELRNTSVFPLSYTLVRQGVQYTNYSGTAVFDASPAEATIAAGASQTVTVTFGPDYASRQEFMAAFRVVVPNQAHENVVVAKGRSWPRQVYALPASRLDDLDAGAPAMQEADVSAPLAVAASMGDAGGDAAVDAPYALRLEFPKPVKAAEEEPLTKTIVVGSAVRSDGRESSAGAYDLVLPADAAAVKSGWFSVANGKGSVAPGATQDVVVTFKPPEVVGGEDSGALDVGQWAEVEAKLVLSGGAKLAGIPDAQNIPVVLRGYVYV